MIDDNELMAWWRRQTTSRFTQYDVDFSGDVFTLMPIEYFLASAIGARTMVEIGVADGSTTLPLLKAAQETGGTVHSVDPSTCEYTIGMIVDRYNAGKWWKFYMMESDEFFAGFNEPIDFAFIDGCHCWTQVSNDIENCMHRLTGKGIILMHDYGGQCEYSDENLPPRGDPEDEEAGGVAKALSVVMPRYPEFSCVQFLGGVMITFNALSWKNAGELLPLSDHPKRLPAEAYMRWPPDWREIKYGKQ